MAVFTTLQRLLLLIMRFFLSSGGAGCHAGFGAGGPDASRGVIAGQFLAVLRQLGPAELVATAEDGVRLARAAAPDALHLCLAMPHELPDGAGVETIPVFGLGQAGWPDRPFAGNPRADWRLRLGGSFGAICLSTHAAASVRALMRETGGEAGGEAGGGSWPVLAVPPPVPGANPPMPPSPAVLRVAGGVLDTACWAETGPPDCPAETDHAGRYEPGRHGADEPAAAPAWPKTARYRLGVTRLHLAYLYREVVRDLLPATIADLVARIGRLILSSARWLMAARHPRRLPASTGQQAPPGLDAPGWLPGIDAVPDPARRRQRARKAAARAATTREAAARAAAAREGTRTVALHGVVFAAVHGAWDRSWGDALSAFVAVCRDDRDATLVVKTALLGETRAGLAGTLRRLGPFACRVVILDGTIEGGLDRLVAASSFYLCASSSEAAPLPMMRFLAAGRPAISPTHSALADFVEPATSFVVASGPDYDIWPGDPEERLAAGGWRLEWESLCEGIAAARALARLPAEYEARSQAMARHMAAWCGEAPVARALASLLAAAPVPACAAPGLPVILVHSETHEGTVAGRLGMPEYSYFFVQRFFRPVLERIGRVVQVIDPLREVDRLNAEAIARGQACVFLSFAPPHRTPASLACPTIPIFAWEFDSIPHEHWAGERRHDWVEVLRTLGIALVHSQTTARTVRAALGDDFPVWSIPAPVWDGFAPAGLAASGPAQPVRQTRLSVRGTVIDTAAIDMAHLRHDENWIERVQAIRAERGRITEVRLDGVVYSSVFNPEDGRKNWTDMLSTFCRVFQGEAGATLVLKLTHHDGTVGLALMLKHLRRLLPFACRVVVMHGYLSDAEYAGLVAGTTYTVNTSHGEGQCLPLMEAMSAGKPAVAPPHTGMADYLDATCAFLVRSTAEPASWPQDGRMAVRTHRRRIDLASLQAAYRRSFDVATGEPATYAAMSLAATERLRRHCSAEIVEARLRAVLDQTFAAAPRDDVLPAGIEHAA